MKTRFVVAFAAVLYVAGAAGAAFARSAPQPAATAAPTAAPQPSSLPTLPPNTGGLINQAVNAVIDSIVKPAFNWNPNHVEGTVTYFRRFDMEVKMQLNRYRDIRLHQGTVIYPRGWTIQPGQIVDVKGRAESNGVLDADVITVRNP